MKLIRHILYNHTGGLPCRFIDRNAQPYLERYYLGSLLGFTFYLHRFVRCDNDFAVHDHPWPAYSLILTGRYQEQRLIRLCTRDGLVNDLRTHTAPGFNRIKCDDAHRIMEVEPETWTLFFHRSKVKKGWGFYSRELDARGSYTITYTQPDQRTDGNPWWETAPLGRTTHRLPYQGY